MSSKMESIRKRFSMDLKDYIESKGKYVILALKDEERFIVPMPDGGRR